MLHRHHIVPKHAGGTNDANNIVFLTPAEHAEAHRVLFEQYGRWQDRVAWQGLAGIIGHEEAVRLSLSAMKGRKHKPETIAKMKQPKSPEHVEKAAAAKRGVRRTEEQKIKMKEAQARSIRGHLTEEQIAALRVRASKPKSVETRTKMAAARKAYWQRRKQAP